MVHGRLAPSPTGAAHLGNAWAFWVAWLAARSAGGACILRMEDIDPARSRPEYAQSIITDLRWLGLDWDEGPDKPDSHAPYSQSLCLALYADILDSLRRKGAVYSCYCTRKELRSIAGAPQIGDMGVPYPGTCRSLSAGQQALFARQGRSCAWRLRCPDDMRWSFHDAVMGRQETSLGECGGDFALRRSDGVFAYQLAVVADDMRMGITQVVRGMDILTSTPRQLFLYSLLGGKTPSYAHLPLVLDAGGERLAKRHASLSLQALREADVKPETLLGWLAFSSGLVESFRPVCAGELAKDFSFARIRPQNIILPPDPLRCFLATQK